MTFARPAALAALLLCAPAFAQAPAAPAKLGYALEEGKTYRYAVTGLFSGHIPPFASPDGPPIHVRARLEYLASVKKNDGKGADVEFAVDKASISLLEKEPGPDGKVDPDAEVEFPLPLSQVQKTLNVSARIAPDGSVTDVKTQEAAPVRLELGVDLRKLFLLVLPVTFPDAALKTGDSWTYDDGLLGKKPGKVSYGGKVVGLKPGAGGLVYRIENTALSQIDDKKTKDGRLTDNAAEAVETTTGTARVTGALTFLTPSGLAGGRRSGRLSEGALTLNAVLKRKAPSPEDPAKTQETAIDVKARLTVKALGPATGAAKKPAPPAGG